MCFNVESARAKRAEVGKVEAATHDAQEKSKAVDKDFAQYVSRLSVGNVESTFARAAQWVV